MNPDQLKAYHTKKLKPNKWYAVNEDREKGGWIISKPFDTKRNAVFRVSTDETPLKNQGGGLYGNNHGGHIGKGKTLVRDGFIDSGTRFDDE